MSDTTSSMLPMRTPDLELQQTAEGLVGGLDCVDLALLVTISSTTIL